MRKYVISISLIVLLIIAWSIVLKNESNIDNINKTNLELANKLYEEEYFYDASKLYKKLSNKGENIKYAIRYAECVYNLNMYDKYEDILIDLNNKYPTDTKIFEKMCDYYLDNDEYDRLIKLINNRNDIKSVAELINRYKIVLKSKYKFSFLCNDEIIAMNNNYYIFKNEKGMGISKISESYTMLKNFEKISFFSETAPSVAAVKRKGDYYFIDSNNNKRIYVGAKYQYLDGFAINGYAKFERNNKFGYIDIEGNEIVYGLNDCLSFDDGNYTFIKKDDSWKMINSEFENVGDNEYEHVFVDELGRSFLNNRAFVRKNNKYALVDEKGDVLTDYIYDEVHLFKSKKQYAAVKINDEYCFINNKGEKIREQKADGIKSYSCGLAPVKIDGFWGFINLDGKIIIEPKFEQVYAFNDVGETIVSNEGRYYSLKLVYYDDLNK